jgi:hypothetical protein
MGSVEADGGWPEESHRFRIFGEGGPAFGNKQQYLSEFGIARFLSQSLELGRPRSVVLGLIIRRHSPHAISFS